MKITIKKLMRKEINTKNGPSWKLSVFDGSNWYGAWAEGWNQDWKEGQTIEVETKSREFGGKTYVDIQAPAGYVRPARAAAPTGQSSEELKLALNDMRKVLGEIRAMVGELVLTGTAAGRGKKELYAVDENGYTEDGLPPPTDADRPPEL